jgi:effector-binding domain-containing protein
VAEDDAQEPAVVPVTPAPTAVVRADVPAGELPAFFDRAFQRLPRVLAAQGVRPVSAAFGLYHRPPSATVDVEVGFVVDRPVQADGDVVPGELPGGRVARVVHAGGFDGLAAAWQRLFAWVGQHGMTPAGVFWEVYLTVPSPGMDPAGLRTELDLLLAG